MLKIEPVHSRIVFVLSLLIIPLTAYCDIADDYNLFGLGIPVMFIETEGGVYPTADAADPPEGCVGASNKNKTTVPGRMYIVDENRDTIFDSEFYEKSESGMTIKLRGNWSGRRDKVSYKLKLEKKIDLIDNNKSKADKNWVLKFDQNMWPHVIPSLKVNELLGLQWTPRYMWVHVVFNGEYRGLYQLLEGIRRNPDCRIDVSKNGYIIEYDAYWWNEDVWFETPLHEQYKYMNYTFKYPDSDEILDNQITYISDYMKTVEQSVKDGTYTEYIDVESFARWLLGADILGISDGAGFNIFITKYDNTSESVVKMANLWDFDSMMKNVGKWSRSHSFFLFPKLLSNVDKTFAERYIDIWEKEGHSVIDSTISYLRAYAESPEGVALDKSLKIDHKRWPIYSVDFNEYVDSVVNWFEGRKVWMDDAIAKLKTEVPVKPIYNDIQDKIQYYDMLGRKVEEYDGKPVKYSKDGRIGIIIGF